VATAADPALEPARARLLTNLATEMCNFLQGLASVGGDPSAGASWLAALDTFLATSLPAAREPSLLTLDAVLVSRAVVALQLRGDYAAAIALLDAPGPLGCFPTYASARSQLMDLWVQAQMAKAAAAAGGRPLTPWEQRNVRVGAPVPRNIGCPFGAGPGYPDCSYW